jgi:hypothetical protein
LIATAVTIGAVTQNLDYNKNVAETSIDPVDVNELVVRMPIVFCAM